MARSKERLNIYNTGEATAFIDSPLGETKVNSVKAELHLIKEIIHTFVF